MARSSERIAVYTETGKKRTFAGAIDWPGWCRSGRDEAAALQALVEYGPAYARRLNARGLRFHAPDAGSELEVTERRTGSTTTDFGAPDGVPADDARPVDEAELQRLQAFLQACWQAFDAAVQAAAGRPLRTGPHGG